MERRRQAPVLFDRDGWQIRVDDQTRIRPNRHAVKRRRRPARQLRLAPDTTAPAVSAVAAVTVLPSTASCSKAFGRGSRGQRHVQAAHRRCRGLPRVCSASPIRLIAGSSEETKTGASSRCASKQRTARIPRRPRSLPMARHGHCSPPTAAAAHHNRQRDRRAPATETRLAQVEVVRTPRGSGRP